MPATASLILFLPAALVMAVTPGPATLLVLSRASAHGRRAGLWTAAGLLTGTMGLVVLAAFGLTGVLREAPLAFELIKSAGAAYLIYLGLRILVGARGRRAATAAMAAGALSRDSQPGAAFYRAGVVTELFNPKAALFYASVLPQFVDVRRHDVPLQMITLGAVFIVFGALSLGLIAIFAGSLQTRLRRNASWQAVTRWLSGAVLIALGVRLAVSRVR
jgi:threonine/homoserine/homoserine lactone efflux protein